MTIKYKEIISSSANIVWRNKFLWFFGLFAALLSGGGSYTSSRREGFTASWQNIKETGIFDTAVFGNISEIASRDPLSLIYLAIVLLAFLALAIFIIWLAVVSQGALIKSVAKIYSNQSRSFGIDFQDGMKSGREKFWPIFFYKVIEKIIVLTLLAILVLPLILALTVSDNKLISTGYYMIVVFDIILALFVSFIIRYSMSYNVIKETDFGKSITDGFNLFKSNFLITIETAIIVFAIGLVLGFIILLMILALAIPFIFLIILFSKIGLDIFLFTILIVGLIILAVIIFVIGGMLSAFGDAIWTIVFLKLIKEKPVSFVQGLFKK